MVEGWESRSHRNLPATVVEGCYTHKVLLVGVVGHNFPEDHSSDHIAVVVNVMEGHIRLGYNLQKDSRLVEVFVSNHSRRHHHRRHSGAVGHRSHPGLDSRTSARVEGSTSEQKRLLFDRVGVVGVRFTSCR